MSEPITAVLVRAAEFIASGHPREAIDLLRPALVANPLHAEAWCRLAAAHLDAGEPDPALNAAKRALVLDGDQAWAQRLAALSLSELGRQSEAVVAARESVRRKPTDWRCHVVLSEVLAADPATRAEAVDAARHATRLAPTEARAFQVLGDAALRAKDWGTAEWAYRGALRLDPTDDDARANLATVHRKRGTTRTPSDPLSNEVLAAAQSIAWQVASQVAALLVAGGLLLLFAGMPRPTPLLGWFSGLLVVGTLALVAKTVLLARKPQRHALRHVARHRPKLAVVVALFTLTLLLLTGWTFALLLGATTMQPLVFAWIISLVAGSVVVLTGQGKPRR
ncbi:tetratricopeptide repeat protein [Umezawaea sp. Da 62-37]|uniref:tetratricopeptide repeat protein n=1 Tax=Umezawaea sp. Da 62-37 TaxID=3075927 RepID=UPI0028F6E885|nr:tetratricopeptide repeat protein [Umezawaea sp. Da 62-37]WNV82825.1 tetratricopeptide repeat protein [Umezawaea sp. Da 62-37]